MKKITIVLFLSALFSVSSMAGSDGELSLSEKNDPSNVKDCFEGVNRAVFAFNQGLDTALFEPVAKVYRKLPGPIKKGSGNFVTNLSHFATIPNNILQGDFKMAVTNTGRLAINTTVGILGIFDAASGIGLPKYEKEDYGQTLAKAGVGHGCYVVLPILGPSSIRDAAGSIANISGGDPWFNITVRNNTTYVKESDYYWSRGTGGIDFRAKNIESFDNLEKNAVDFYASVRSLYLQDRKQKILNSKKIIDTQDDSDWEEISEN